MQSGGDGGPSGRSCPRCARAVPEDSRFCPFCGAPNNPIPPPSYPPAWLPPPRKSGWQSAKDAIRTASTWFIFLVLVEVTVNVGILIWGSTLVLPEIPGYTKLLYIITPWIVDIVKLEGPTLIGYFFFLVFAVTASFAYMIYRSLPQLPNELRGEAVKEHTPLYRVGTLFCATVFCSFLVYGLLALFNVNPIVPDFAELPLWKQIFSMAGASVWEEVTCRTLLIGVPLLAYHLITHQAKDYKRYFLGGNIAFDHPGLVLLIFSSTMFALAHLFIWDGWKLIPTFASGLALGYLFMRYGIYAAIMLHFFIDFLTIPLEVWPSSDLVLVAVGLLIWGILIVGAIYFIFYFIQALDFMNGGPILGPKADPLAMAAPQTAYPSHPVQDDPPSHSASNQFDFGFKCKSCGHGEARYQDGALHCTRCGQKQ